MDTFRQLLVNQTDAVDPKTVKKAGATERDGKDMMAGVGQEEGEGCKKVYSVPVLVTPEAAARIRAKAEGMITCGQERLCLKTFKEVRAAKLELGLQRIGVEELSREEVGEMDFKELEERFEGWRKQVKLALNVVLVAERAVCEETLRDLDPHTGRAFAELGDLASKLLFAFPQAVANSKVTQTRLALLLDMYETMRDLMPQVNVVFAGQACNSLRVEAQGVLQSLAAAAKEAFNEFEEAVETEDSNKIPPDGSTHGLTAYVVPYLMYLCDYQATLQELFNVDNMAEAMVRILTALQKFLEKKAKLYKEPSQKELFLMNNMHNIVQTVKKSELREILGEDWMAQQRRTVQEHAKAYQQIAWKPVIGLLSMKGLSVLGRDDQISKNTAKERFKTFNATFEELHRMQCLWKIPDPELRTIVQLQIAEVLLPAYRFFVQKCKPVLEVSKFGGIRKATKHIKYSEEDLGLLLDELFLGKDSKSTLVPSASAKGQK